jgi:hypothetical protein
MVNEPAAHGHPDPGSEGEPGGDGGPQVGDLAILPLPRVRDAVGCGERVGVVLEDRRNVVKVFFPEIDRAFWIDREEVLAVPEGRLATPPLAQRLHRIARALAAVAVEIYDREGDADVFHVFTRGTTLEDLLRVRDLLGSDLRRMGIDPGGVRRARVTLVFRTG